MIDLEKALVGNDAESAKIQLLDSRAIIGEVLCVQPALGSDICSRILSRCLEEFNAWKPKGTLRPELDRRAAGWLNLFIELFRNGDGGSCDGCDTVLGESDNVDHRTLLAVFIAARRSGNHAPILGQRAGVEQVQELWHSRRSQWTAALTLLAESGVGQSLIMHLLETLLPQYQRAKRPIDRAVLNLLLVELVRVVFLFPDRAYLTYSRYHSISKTDGGGAEPFHQLYSNDLGVVREFQNLGMQCRTQLLALVRNGIMQASPLNDALPVTIQNGANRLIHGTDADAEATSPDLKKTRLSQITCLIRDLRDDGISQGSDEAITRRYASHLKGIHYRQAELLTPNTPGTFRWKRRSQESVEAFIKCVDARYEAGYDVGMLSDLFAPAAAESSVFHPVWILDGEIAFLWLLTALRTAGDLEKWINGSLADDVRLPLEAVTHRERTSETGSGSISFGRSLRTFAEEHACLFDATTGMANPRAWSLVTFLQRAVLSRTPAAYASDGAVLAPLVSGLYENLKDNPLSFDTFRKAVLALAKQPEWANVTGVESIERNCRIQTFLLEVLLRDKDKTPYSLFFYPINFDSVGQNKTVPGVFLAGTFAGLEWDCYPTVTERQNLHLFTLLDALRPIVDYEIGRVLATDQTDYGRSEKQLEQASELKLAAEQRARTVEAVLPSIKHLSELFLQANSHVFRIQSAVDPDWSGLFAESTSEVFREMFDTDRPLAIPTAVKPEPTAFKGAHEVTANEEKQKLILYQRLVYLARTVFTYDVQTPLGTEDALWPVDELRANHHILFASNPFLKSLLDCAASKSADAKNLNLLLKSLTVDSSDSGRGVHVAQIAAALGMSAAATRQAKKKNVLSIPPARVFFDSRQVHGMSFNPTTTEGLTELAGVIEQELGLNQKLRSTADFVARVRLRNDAEPFRFLRALRLLGSESLNDSREGRVRLVDWKVRFSSTPFKSILIELTCHNHFSTAAKQALWEHHQHGRDEIHNLRRHFGELCRCVGAFPLFMTAHDAAKYPEPGPSSLFVIVETYDAVLLRNISTFRILLVEPPIQS